MPTEQQPTTPTESYIEELVREFDEIYEPNEGKLPKVVGVEDGLQMLYKEQEDIQILEYAIERIDDETEKVTDEVSKYISMLMPLKAYEERVLGKKDSMLDILRRAQKFKRGLVTENAIADLEITEGMSQIIRHTNAESKKPVTPILREQVDEVITVNDSLPILPEDEVPEKVKTEAPPAAEAAPPEGKKITTQAAVKVLKQ